MVHFSSWSPRCWNTETRFFCPCQISQSSFGSQLLLIHHPPKRKKAQRPSLTGHSSKRHKAPSKFGILFWRRTLEFLANSCSLPSLFKLSRMWIFGYLLLITQKMEVDKIWILAATLGPAFEGLSWTYVRRNRFPSWVCRNIRKAILFCRCFRQGYVLISWSFM